MRLRHEKYFPRDLRGRYCDMILPHAGPVSAPQRRYRVTMAMSQGTAECGKKNGRRIMGSHMPACTNIPQLIMRERPTFSVHSGAFIWMSADKSPGRELRRPIWNEDAFRAIA